MNSFIRASTRSTSFQRKSEIPRKSLCNPKIDQQLKFFLTLAPDQTIFPRADTTIPLRLSFSFSLLEEERERERERERETRAHLIALGLTAGFGG